MRFGPERIAQFVDTLMAAFSIAELRTVLVRRFGIDLDDIAEPGVRFARFQSAAGHFNRASEIERLVLAAHDERPNDEALRAFADGIVQPPPAPGLAELERRLAEQVPYIDPVLWRRREEKAEVATCAITLTAEGKVGGGTGFLVSPDLVLTAAHVLQPVIDTLLKKKSTADAAKVRFRFDYKNESDGQTPSFGVTYHLHDGDWLLAHDPEALDFALVRLHAPAGDHAVGKSLPPTKKAKKETRGSIVLPRGKIAYPPNTPLQILHHPLGDELKLAIEMQSIVNVESNPPRLYHRTNTDGGSSGAPCFDLDWNLIALHRGTEQGGYNQAVPIPAIVAALRKANVLEAITP